MLLNLLLLQGTHLTYLSLLTGTSLLMTVLRSVGNDYRHFDTWCWTQTGRTGEASICVGVPLYFFALHKSSWTVMEIKT